MKPGKNDSETKKASQEVKIKEEARPVERPQEKVAKKRILRVIRGQSEELVMIRSNPVE
ncbi:MAG: hypothetical protein ACKO85_16950 [Isosphaeraceae bacterium]